MLSIAEIAGLAAPSLVQNYSVKTKKTLGDLQ